jgi:murein DD-endopeptidase MepM/ murein hydrolase activator NlpD
MIATGAASRARVRTLPLARIAIVGAALACGLLGAGVGVGYQLAALNAEPAAASAVPAPAQPHGAAVLPLALQQIGALSGRLFRLESQAAQLGQRVGLPAPAAAASAARGASGPAPSGAAASAAPAAGQGGPMLDARPRAALAGLEALDAHLERLEAQFARLSDAAADHASDAMRVPSRWPVIGAALTSGFGNRSDPFTSRHAFHAGLDFAAGAGAPILAAAGGHVSFAGFHPDYGWMVEIEHGNGLRTRYAHASRLLVQRGAIVAPGERIAAVGSTGRSTGPHLHFEVLRHGRHVDPKRYLSRVLASAGRG